MSYTIYIGIGYQKQTGKETFARALSDRLRADGVTTTVRHFAYPLKQLVQNVYGASWKAMNGPGAYRDEVPPHWVRSSTGGRTWREVLQLVGCAAREQWPDIWLRHAFKPLKSRTPGLASVVLIADVRFKEELAFLRSQPISTSYCITRKGAEKDGHYSESVLSPDMFDRVVENDWTVDDLVGIAESAAKTVMADLVIPNFRPKTESL